MGARHSKRSMDVTSTPKKEGLSADGGDTPTIGDGKLERIEEIDAKPTTNGVAPHIDTPEEKDIKDKDSATEKEKDKNGEETKVDTQAESPTEGGENVTTPTEETVASPTSVTSPETKESKKKDKPKKKWSFRSISFSKKDKNKPVREETPKNGDVSKDEPLTEGGEDAENVVAAAATAVTAAAPEVNETEEKTPPTSPTESSSTPVVEAKEDDKSALPPPPSSGVAAEASSIDDKNEATVAAVPSSPIAPTPVPVEAKNDEAEKEEVEKKTVEVSPVQAVAIPVEVTTHTQPIVTSSIIERKTSEEFHSLFPSSPPPTPIDPSPIQKAQQAAANADALAEALKFPVQTIKQSENNSCVANDQENSYPVIESSENIIEIHPKADQVSLNIANVQENVSELKALEEQNEQQQSTLLSAAILQPDLVIQTEEGPIPISNSDIEVEIESVRKITDNDIEKIVDQVSDTSKIIHHDSEIIMDTDEISADDELLENKVSDEINIDETEDDIPPPLPDSPIPMPKTKTDLLSFMTSQIEDSSTTLTNIIKITSPQSSECANTTVDKIELQNELCDAADSSSDILPPPQDVENFPLPPSAPEVAAYEIIQDSNISNPETPIENLLTPPISPTPRMNYNFTSLDPQPNRFIRLNDKVVVECSDRNCYRCQSRLDRKDIGGLTNKIEERHYIEVDEALAAVAFFPLKDMLEGFDEQSKLIFQAPIETNSVSDSFTETIEDVVNDELPDSPIPPTSKGPMITEDVASVTKAVEEIDINEKAVAAAVNENIECITKNEIIAEMNHQNNLNE